MSIRRKPPSPPVTKSVEKDESIGEESEAEFEEFEQDELSPSSAPSSKQTSSKKKKKPRNIYVNLSCCKYRILRDSIAHFGWAEATEERDWNLFWTDTSVCADRLKRMKSYQKINHFPGTSEITRKDTFAKNMNRMKKLFPDEYKFVPMSWILPHDLYDLKTFCASKRYKKTLIAKPDASCQGRGIFLTRNPDDLSSSNDCVVQTYLSKPHLINGYKYDLRVYVLLASVTPLKIFLHKSGLVRFATEKYKKPTTDNLSRSYMHLTNYAVNKRNKNFVFNKGTEEMGGDGSKWDHEAYRVYMREQENVDVEALWTKIGDVCIKAILPIQALLAHTYRLCTPQDEVTDRGSMCFEVLGFDVMIDSHYDAHVLEVNHSPSFNSDTPLDHKVKFSVITDTLRLMNINNNDRILYNKLEKQKHYKRMMVSLQSAPKADRPPSASAKPKPPAAPVPVPDRTAWEDAHCGDYIRVYPTARTAELNYDRFIVSPTAFFAHDTVASKARREQTLKQAEEKKAEQNKLAQAKKDLERPPRVTPLRKPLARPVRPPSEPSARQTSSRESDRNTESVSPSEDEVKTEPVVSEPINVFPDTPPPEPFPERIPTINRPSTSAAVGHPPVPKVPLATRPSTAADRNDETFQREYPPVVISSTSMLPVRQSSKQALVFYPLTAPTKQYRWVTGSEMDEPCDKREARMKERRRQDTYDTECVLTNDVQTKNVRFGWFVERLIGRRGEINWDLMKMLARQRSPTPPPTPDRQNEVSTTDEKTTISNEHPSTSFSHPIRQHTQDPPHVNHQTPPLVVSPDDQNVRPLSSADIKKTTTITTQSPPSTISPSFNSPPPAVPSQVSPQPQTLSPSTQRPISSNPSNRFTSLVIPNPTAVSPDLASQNRDSRPSTNTNVRFLWKKEETQKLARPSSTNARSSSPHTPSKVTNLTSRSFGSSSTTQPRGRSAFTPPYRKPSVTLPSNPPIPSSPHFTSIPASQLVQPNTEQSFPHPAPASTKPSFAHNRNTQSIKPVRFVQSAKANSNESLTHTSSIHARISLSPPSLHLHSRQSSPHS